MTEQDSETIRLLASLRELISAVFNGAPTQEAAQRYTARLTALISIYICFVAVFLIGVYVHAIQGRRGTLEEGRTFKVWIAYSLMFAVLAIAADLGWFFLAAQ